MIALARKETDMARNFLGKVDARASKRRCLGGCVCENVLCSIQASPSQYHVVRNALDILDAEVLREDDPSWTIEPGRTYAVVRADASLVAFRVPKTGSADEIASSARFEIGVVHTDSPTFKLKEHPIIEREGCSCLNVEEYGGAIHKSWFDRPLSVAGRACVQREDGSFATCLVDLADKVSGIIPSLAPHMGAKDEDEVSVQSNMCPIIAMSWQLQAMISGEDIMKRAVAEDIEQRYGFGVRKVMSWDLSLYVLDVPAILGIGEGALVASPQLDDQGSVWPAVMGFADAVREGVVDEQVGVVPVLALLDNEENGSMSRAGADSTFLSDVLTRVAEILGIEGGAYKAMLARSFMVSADNAHAANPNYAGKADPTNKVGLGCGIVLKYSANQKYMTDARGAAVFKAICDGAGIKYQVFHNNSDVKGGSTLGNISGTHVSVAGCDIGLPQLAMHSAYEVCGKADIASMHSFFKTYFGSAREVDVTTDGIVC